MGSKIPGKLRFLADGVDSQALSLALREALDAAWRQVIEARFGYATYADMRAALRDG